MCRERIGDPAVRERERYGTSHGFHFAVVTEGVRRLQILVVQLPYRRRRRHLAYLVLDACGDIPVLAAIQYVDEQLASLCAVRRGHVEIAERRAILNLVRRRG